MNLKKISLLLISIFFLSSCEKEEPVPAEPVEMGYRNGLIILNEGNFGSANASVSFLNENTNETEKQLFQNVNGSPLGDTAQSMAFYEDLAIIVLNVSNKIEIVNRETFQSVASITTNVSNPRYALVENGELYVSNWGDGMDPADDFIAVFDISNYSFKEKIEVSEGPEQMKVANNSLYVAHIGGFSYSDKISVIDLASKIVKKQIEVGFRPNSMVVDGDKLWVLSSGKSDYPDPAEETSGSLASIDLNTGEVISKLDFSGNAHPDHLVIYNNNLFYTIGKSVFKFEPAGTLSDTPVFIAEEAAILYGFSIKDNKAYIASPNADYTGDGNLYIYDLSDGSLLDQYSTGINPNSVYFN
ncbi:hypothetical protein C7S20_16065 [Christiangramia fulva]|uniref:Cell surface protein n=1 Tax=Christiangramia fulva TaxID=2126553 RepID=A0A2R3Z8Q1_9FLAO|nr:DUF5074 domain-containing protein [Christiangramia fulva]AVR46658.1 hypothetical protein C7S20_16065 [Christiangramia fulva]